MGLVSDWTVDYGQGPRAIRVPHAWGQEVDLRWEGPAIYRTSLQVGDALSWLVFHGVSYAADVLVEGERVGRHEGIWDAFSIPLERFSGRRVDVEVHVVKNGGPTFPVRDVASGFLPYVFHTFGGIFGEVEHVVSSTDPLANEAPAPPSRVGVDGHRLTLEGEPFYVRGLLHWGWFPELGHPNPPDDVIRAEVRAAKAGGFNLVKFCLWVPSHRYLEILAEEEMEAWLELPLWDPTPDAEAQARICCELERVVRQYRRHGNIAIWTCGCELSGATSPEYRKRLVEMVKGLTGSPMVKDNSGGAEMYGGDPREFGDFEDFHPYCDLHFYPEVLDSLLPGPRPPRPLLLGEFNDYDVCRDLAKFRSKRPYWLSLDPAVNDQGVRWQHVLPEVIENDPIAGERLDSAIAGSRSKSEFIRQRVYEEVRARRQISGFVITGWRDTPISSSGFFDGDGSLKRLHWMPTHPEDVAFIVPRRRPPWVRGGNRTGWQDSHNHFVGPINIQIGFATVRGIVEPIGWEIWAGDRMLEAGECLAALSPLESRLIGEATVVVDRPADLELRIPKTGQSWRLSVFASPIKTIDRWSIVDPEERFHGIQFSGGENRIATQIIDPNTAGPVAGNEIFFLAGGPCTISMPFWRECAFEYATEGCGGTASRFVECFADNWDRLLPISPDCALDLQKLNGAFGLEFQNVMTRLDTRTYRRHAILAIATTGSRQVCVTTLRPDGGHGCQPYGVLQNPAGWRLLELLMDLKSHESTPNGPTEPEGSIS